MELYLFVLREGKNIFLARQFLAWLRLLARRGHGFHTQISEDLSRFLSYFREKIVLNIT